ncbi:MAG: PAS domain-containing protein [Rhodothalassiaceae bacterium]
MRQPTPIKEELFFDTDEIIVSKTDATGKIRYANDVFCRLAEMPTEQLIGQPHSVIRHPDMPRAIFRLLWESIQAGRELFAYIKNISATGRYYWVIAHVTPSMSPAGELLGYHSNRRKPSPGAIREIETWYQELRFLETAAPDRKQGLEASWEAFNDRITKSGKTYDEFIWDLGARHV